MPSLVQESSHRILGSRGWIGHPVLGRLGFAARLFLASALLVVLALGISGLVTYAVGYGIARNDAGNSLEHSRAVQQNFQKLRFQQLNLMAQFMATDPAILNYLVKSGGDSQSGHARADVRSIADLLSKRQMEVGFDFGMVLDPHGVLLARSGDGNTGHENMATDSVVAAAMQSQAAASGYWLRDGRAYQVVVARIADRAHLSGYLVLALGMDKALLQDVKQVSGAELVLLDTHGGKYSSVTSTLDQQRLDALNQALADLHPLPTGVFDLKVSGEHWLAYVDPLGQEGSAGAALTLTSFDQAMGGFSSILAVQFLVALVATLLAVSCSWWLSRRLGKPLRELADAAQSAARGDFQRRFKADGEGEIARLTRAFDSLLSDLREKSEIENYMADLAKYQPEGTSDHAVNTRGAATSPESLSGAFLAVRLHDTLDANLAMPDRVVMAFNQVLRNLEMPAILHDGKLVATAGNTVFMVFKDVESAFTVAGQIMHVAESQGQKLSTAAALGTIIIGPVEWTSGGAASLIGVPIRQLEEMLPDAMPGMLLVTTEFAKAARSFAGAKSRRVVGVSTGRELNQLQAVKPLTSTPGEIGTFAATQRMAGSGALIGTPKLFPGMLLDSRYEILTELGIGGNGVVYKARDRQLNELVAIKTIKYEDSQDTPLLDAMKSEIRLARKITHRNVVRIYDLGEVGGVPFISMEYVRGMTLRYLLQNRALVPFAAGLRIMRQVCTALQVAHEQSVLHRDIKPENVMLEPSGNAKLMDFGLASRIRYGHGPTAKLLVVGTQPYSSPEQLRGEEVDERTDIYACGVMMYQMFTGKLPFNARDIAQLIEQQDHEEYLAPIAHVLGFPAPLAALIGACLKADRELRPKSAAVVLEALENMRF